MESFAKLDQVHERMKANGGAGYCFASDLRNGAGPKLFYYAPTLDVAYNMIYAKPAATERHFYEVLLESRPCKLHLDIEIEVQNDPSTIQKHTDDLDKQQHLINEWLCERLGGGKITLSDIRFETLYSNGVTAQSNRYKLSRHVVYTGLGMFRNNHVVLKHLVWNELLKRFPTLCIDKNIYSRNRLIRLVDNCKKGSTRVLRLFKSTTSSYDVTFDEWKRLLIQDDFFENKSWRIFTGVNGVASTTLRSIFRTVATKKPEPALAVKAEASIDVPDGLLEWLESEICQVILFPKNDFNRLFERRAPYIRKAAGTTISVPYARRAEFKGREEVVCPIASLLSLNSTSSHTHASNGFCLNVHLLARRVVMYCFGESGHRGVKQMRIKRLVPIRFLSTIKSREEFKAGDPTKQFVYRYGFLEDDTNVQPKLRCECDKKRWVETKLDRAASRAITIRCMQCDSVQIIRQRKRFKKI